MTPDIQKIILFLSGMIHGGRMTVYPTDHDVIFSSIPLLLSHISSLQSRIELLEGGEARAKELLRQLTRCHSDCEASPCIHTDVIDFLSSPS